MSNITCSELQHHQRYRRVAQVTAEHIHFLPLQGTMQQANWMKRTCTRSTRSNPDCEQKPHRRGALRMRHRAVKICHAEIPHKLVQSATFTTGPHSSATSSKNPCEATEGFKPFLKRLQETSKTPSSHLKPSSRLQDALQSLSLSHTCLHLAPNRAAS